MFWLATTEVRSGSSILGDCSVWYRPVPTFAYRESLVKSAKNSCILFPAEVSVSLCLFSSEFFQPIMRPVVSGFFTSVSFDTYKLNTSLRACYFLKMNSALWWGELNASSHFLWNTSLCLGDGFSKGCGQTKYDLFGAVYLFFFLSVSATWTLDHRTGRFPCLILGFFPTQTIVDLDEDESNDEPGKTKLHVLNQHQEKVFLSENVLIAQAAFQLRWWTFNLLL